MSACGGGGGGGSSPPPPPDTVAPDTTLSSTPTARTNLASLPFVATSNESGVTFEARVDAGAYSAVPATFSLSGLDEGPHTIDVRARDAAGNIDASPATFAVVIDRTPPDTTLSSGPSGPITASTSATFTFTSENNASFEVSLDGAPYAQAASPFTLTGVTNGAHTLSIRAIDQAGNVDPSPASSTWMTDIAAPNARVLFPTRHSYTESSTLRVRGTADDSVAIAAVSVNGVAATTSDGYAHWTATVPIATGDNALHVAATDALGNTGASVARIDVANRGIAIGSLRSIVKDQVRNRILGADITRGAIVAIDLTSGLASILSDASRGTGPAFTPVSDFFLQMDALNDRLLVMRGDTLLEVDPVTGNRTVIPTAAPTPQSGFGGSGIACNADCALLYAPNADPTNAQGILSINPLTGARTLVTGGAAPLGTGPSLGSIVQVIVDTPNSRLLVLDQVRRAILAVDLATGDRSYLSAPAVGTGADFRAPRSFVLDPVGRAIVTDTDGGFGGNLVTVDLANGNRFPFPTLAVDATLDLAQLSLLDNPASRLLMTTNGSNLVEVRISGGNVRRVWDSRVGTGNAITGNHSLLFDRARGSWITPGVGGVLLINPSTSDRTLGIATPYGSISYPPAHLNFDTRAGAPASRLIGLGPGDLATPMVLRSYDVVAGTDTILTGTTMPYSSTFFPFDGPNSRFVATLPSPSRLVSIDAASGAQVATITDSSIGPVPFSGISAIAFEDLAGGGRRILMQDSSQLLSVDPATGTRSVISSDSVGAGPRLISPDSIAVDSTGRRALVSSGHDLALQWVDLANGNRTIASGVNPDDQTVRGIGPPILYPNTSVQADYAAELAYVLSGGTSLVTVDLITGDRVITSR